MGIFDEIVGWGEAAAKTASKLAKEGVERGRCLVGNHDWAEWVFVEAGLCSQKRACARPSCTTVRTRVSHDWQDFAYVAKKSCAQEQKCGRCPNTIERVEHAGWTDFNYVADDSCERVSRCRRCQEQVTDFEHEGWSDWTYKSDAACDEVRHCLRCAEAEARIVHNWGKWEFAGPRTCDQVRFCRHCKTAGETRGALSDEDHRFEPYTRIDCYYLSLRCERCSQPSARRLSNEKHDYGPWRTDGARDGRSRDCSVCHKTDYDDCVMPR